MGCVGLIALWLNGSESCFGEIEEPMPASAGDHPKAQ